MNGGRFLAGMKPFRLPFEIIHFHEELGDKFEFMISCERRETRADAKRKL